MKVFRERKGQFIVIAALLLSIMIVSVSMVIYGTVTYFRQERWEEYLTIVDSVKTGSFHLLEMSLSKYSQTQTLNQTILRDNLNQWVRDVRKAYPGFGVDLSYSLETGAHLAYGMTPNYNMGLNRTWDKNPSYSTANTTFSINIASVGLTGYNFSAHAFLKMNIADALWHVGQGQSGWVGVRVIIEAEGPTPVTNLRTANFVLFQVGGVNQTFTLYRYYESQGHPVKQNPTPPALNAFVYELRYSASSKPDFVNVIITVKDSRGVQVRGAVNNLAVIDY